MNDEKKPTDAEVKRARGILAAASPLDPDAAMRSVLRHDRACVAAQVERVRAPDTTGVAYVRSLLERLDAGAMSPAELEAHLSDAYFMSVLDHIERLEPGDKLVATGSCCCSSHLPERSFTVKVTIQPHGYTLEKVEPTAVDTSRGRERALFGALRVVLDSVCSDDLRGHLDDAWGDQIAEAHLEAERVIVGPAGAPEPTAK